MDVTTACSSGVPTLSIRLYPIAVTLPGMRTALMGGTPPKMLTVPIDSTDGTDMCSTATVRYSSTTRTKLSVIRTGERVR